MKDWCKLELAEVMRYAAQCVAREPKIDELEQISGDMPDGDREKWKSHLTAIAKKFRISRFHASMILLTYWSERNVRDRETLYPYGKASLN